jgi:hypothetical protein
MDENAQLFLKYNFSETKDLCKHFLTVVTAVLVFSLTFSDKVVSFATASVTARRLLVVAWSLMLLSIIACGIGLCYISLAGGDAVYKPSDRYLKRARVAYSWIIIAGSSFVLGLISQIATAAVTVYPWTR